jgi:diguanylate cyclase (GGDEF)-like protein/PAS domain S-box-containing protein
MGYELNTGGTDDGSPASGTDYAAIVAASSDLITVVDRSGRFRYVSPASQRLFGWAPAELEGQLVIGFVHAEDGAMLQLAYEYEGSVPAVACYRFLCRDGSYCWVEASTRGTVLDDAPVLVSTIRNIDDRRRRTVQLERLATTDPLTGAANRSVLMDRLAQGIRRLGRGSGVLAVIYLDLDHFKAVNDSFGHAVGDSVLVTITGRLAHHLRPADTLARVGGDEFVVIAEGLEDAAAALDLAERVIAAGRSPVAFGDIEFVCTISVGMTCTPDAGQSAEELLAQADLALYRAKSQGRDRVEVFDQALMSEKIFPRLANPAVRREGTEDRIAPEYLTVIDLGTEVHTPSP